MTYRRSASWAEKAEGPGAAQCMSRLLFANDFWHDLGSRSYVSGLLIDTRVVALLGLRTRRDLISGKVRHDRQGRQILGA